MKRISFLLAGVFLCSICCPISLANSGPAGPKPSQQEVVGIYQVTAQNLTDTGLDTFKGHQPLITINNDGTCVVDDFPVWTGSWPYTITEWLSYSGQWSIVVGHQRHWGIMCKGTAESMGLGDLNGNRDGYSITFPFGDPDDYDYMEFEKMP